MKCDEAKPFCNRCTTTGRKCDGYLALNQPSNDGAPEIISACISPEAPFDALEKRTFEFFRLRYEGTVKRL